MELGAEAWRGRAHEDLEEMGLRLFEKKIAERIYPGDARPRPGPPAQGPHRGAQLLGHELPGRAGGAAPRHRRGHLQPLRRRGRPAHRRGRRSRCSGARARPRPCRRFAADAGRRPRPELLLRRRRRGRRPDVPGRPPPADQPGRPARGRGQEAGLARPAVHQPGRRAACGSWPARSSGMGSMVPIAGAGARHRAPAPRQAGRHELRLRALDRHDVRGSTAST